MSNRPQSLSARWSRAAKNARARLAALPASPVLRRPNGDVARSEGRRNYTYGVPKGTHPSILSLHAQAARNKYPSTPPTDALSAVLARGGPDLAELLNSMTRDQLRAVAKRLGLTGYGKYNKAQLVAAVSA